MISHVVSSNVHDYINSRSMIMFWCSSGCFCKHVSIDSELCQLFSANVQLFFLAYYLVLYRKEVYSSRYTRGAANGVIEVLIVWSDWSILSTVQGWVQPLRNGTRRGWGGCPHKLQARNVHALVHVQCYFSITHFFIKPQSYKMISYFPQYNGRGINGGSPLKL